MKESKKLPVMDKVTNDRLTKLLKEDKEMVVAKSSTAVMVGLKHQLN